MKRLAAQREEYHFRLAVVIQYGATEVFAAAPGWDRPTLLQCLREQRIDVVDTFDQLRSIYLERGEDEFKRLWVMHDDGHTYGHMSPEGNRLIAQLIATQVFGKTAEHDGTR